MLFGVVSIDYQHGWYLEFVLYIADYPALWLAINFSSWSSFSPAGNHLQLLTSVVHKIRYIP